VRNMLDAFGVIGISIDFGGKTLNIAKICLENKFFNKFSSYIDVVSYS
jgi:hypothetical protein